MSGISIVVLESSVMIACVLLLGVSGSMWLLTSAHPQFNSALCDVISYGRKRAAAATDDNHAAGSLTQRPMLFVDTSKSNWPDINAFIAQFGSREVLQGSESSIVFSNGRAFTKRTILDSLIALSSRSVYDNTTSESIVFDLSLTDLVNAFPVPTSLRSIFNERSIETTETSTVLSMGAVDTGCGDDDFYIVNDAALYT